MIDCDTARDIYANKNRETPEIKGDVLTPESILESYRLNYREETIPREIGSRWGNGPAPWGNWSNWSNWPHLR